MPGARTSCASNIERLIICFEDAILDKIDKKILSLVQDNCRIAAEEIGAAVGLSHSAVHRRLANLRKEGVILEDVAIIDPAAVGRPISLIVQVTLVNDSGAVVNRFRKMIRNTPQIQQCYFVTGEADYIMVYLAESMEEYERFASETFFDDPHVKSFTTSVVMQRVKSGLKVPV